jgi:hypothetical protein
MPSQYPSEMPSELPSEMPSELPSEMPSQYPSEMPSELPSEMPSEHPTCKIELETVRIKGPVQVNGKPQIKFVPIDKKGTDPKKDPPRKFKSKPDAPFETTKKRVCEEFTLESKCHPSKDPNKKAPVCDVTIKLSYCDKGKNCGGGKDDGCRTGTIIAKGQGAEQYKITGGTGDFVDADGTFDAESILNPPKTDVLELDKVDINFCFPKHN